MCSRVADRGENPTTNTRRRPWLPKGEQNSRNIEHNLGAEAHQSGFKLNECR